MRLSLFALAAALVAGRAAAQDVKPLIDLRLRWESTTALVERYFSGLNGKTQYPLIGDPENLELNDSSCSIGACRARRSLSAASASTSTTSASSAP